MTVTVVGGGIAGLAAAWELVCAGREVRVLEAGDRFGGKIKTSAFAGRPVDEGADAFLARVPAGAALAREVGLGDELVSPATGQASLWIGARLKPIPTGHVLGVPVDLQAVAKAGILSAFGLARAAVEPLLPGRALGADEDVAVGELITRRFGSEVQQLLVDPLLGGINAGRSDELSIEIGAAQLAAAARKDRSLGRGLRALRAATPVDPNAPVFYAPTGGMQRLVDALVEGLRAKGATLSTRSAVEPGSLDGDVVLATPAYDAARLIEPLSARAADALFAFEYASVALVTLQYSCDDLRAPLTGSGFLVPRREGRFLTAGSVFTNKWPALAGGGDGDGDVIVRASAGRFGDDRAMQLDDDALVATASGEVRVALGIGGEALGARVSRWPAAFPQFRPGHLRRVEALEAALGITATAPLSSMAWRRRSLS